MSCNEEEPSQRDRAAAFLCRWIRDSNDIIDSCGSVSSGSDRGTFGGRGDCSSRSSRVSSSSIDGIEEWRYGKTEYWEFLKTVGLLNQEGLEMCDDVPLAARKHNDLNIRKYTHNLPGRSSSAIRNSKVSHPEVPISLPKQPTPKSSPLPQASREVVVDGSPPRRSSSTEDYLPSKLKTMNLAPASEHRSGLRVISSSSTIVGENIVSRLPWIEPLSGIAGRYTGQINDRMQPHGYGALVYKNKSATPSIWENGIPFHPWSLEDVRPRPLSKNETYVHKLKLGDIGTPDHMTPADASQSALEKINSLQTHDFVFILRSSGQWTYAIIADRKEHCILFVVDTIGNTKTLAKNHLAASIRLVNPKEVCSPDTIRRNTRRKEKARKK